MAMCPYRIESFATDTTIRRNDRWLLVEWQYKP
jgi:hypothetical protein